MTNFLPKKHRYIIGKEVIAVSIADALRRERNATVTEIRIIEEDVE